MSEILAATMLNLSNVLHWMGKYHERDAVNLFYRILRSKNIETLDELKDWVETIELGEDGDD